MVVSGATAAVVSSFMWSRGLVRFRRRQFLDVLNVSLNTYNPALRRFTFRTVHEGPLATILPPQAERAVARAAAAAQRAPDCVVQLPEDVEFVVYNRLSNLLSSQCHSEWRRLDAGDPGVREEPYVVVLTAEPLSGAAPGMARWGARQTKVRAMLLRRDTVATLAAVPPDAPQPEWVRKSNSARWALLTRLSRRYCDETGLTAAELAALAPEQWPTQRRFWNLMLCSAA